MITTRRRVGHGLLEGREIPLQVEGALSPLIADRFQANRRIQRGDESRRFGACAPAGVKCLDGIPV
jgi:hypothetical protein